jgi:hypothetical protein
MADRTSSEPSTTKLWEYPSCTGSHCLHVEQLAISTEDEKKTRRGGERTDGVDVSLPAGQWNNIEDWRYDSRTAGQWRRLEARLHGSTMETTRGTAEQPPCRCRSDGHNSGQGGRRGKMLPAARWSVVVDGAAAALGEDGRRQEHEESVKRMGEWRTGPLVILGQSQQERLHLGATTVLPQT